jgi:hypothetical protein
MRVIRPPARPGQRTPPPRTLPPARSACSRRYEGRGEVTLPHPLLKRSHWDARRSHPGSKSVTEVVEPDVAKAGAAKGRLEALQHLGAVERRALLAAVRMGEDQVLGGLEWRAVIEALKLAGEAIR